MTPLIFATIGTLSLGLILALGIHLMFETVQTAQATGCPTQFVNEHIDNALKAYEEKNAEEVKNELDLAKQALSAAAAELE